jgi:mRNA interferase HigB
VTVLRSDRLLEFGKKHADARKALAAWLASAHQADWANIQQVRQTYRHADAVTSATGRVLTVFNIKGNHYRLVVAIDYPLRLVNVLCILTHAEYNRDTWKDKI